MDDLLIALIPELFEPFADDFDRGGRRIQE
jgi:hypothetical protein